ncbi:MAG: hypothetical protein NUW23_15180, partial [Firmicutes bacterium]|nr:hypothetical protein [Bacillota bacterium]
VAKWDRNRAVRHLARVGAELGADIIKTLYTGDAEGFRAIAEECYAPIMVLGGPGDQDVVSMVADAVKAGAQGAIVGRAIWQSSDMRKTLDELVGVIRTTR